MKRIPFFIITLVLALVGGAVAKAQTAMQPPTSAWQGALTEIAHNNVPLQVAQKELQAQQLANGAELRLPDPEAEVAYLFGSPSTVPNRTNVSLTQTLDWGVLLGRRKQLSVANNQQSTLRFQQQWQQVMAQADGLLTQLVYYNRLLNELQQRKALADELSALYQQKFNRGDLNQLELNKMQLNAAVSLAELTRAKADREQLLQQLQQLNGGKRIEVADTLYPQQGEALPPLSQFTAAVAAAPSVQLAQNGVTCSQAALRVAKAEALPQLTVGFQGEYIKQNNYSGLSVGFTLPLWGNARRKVKQAEAEVLVQQLSVDDAKLQQTARIEQQYAQATTLLATAQQLTANLQQTSNAHLLRRSLDLGQISLLDYLLELSFFYTARTAQLEAERDAQLAVSALRWCGGV